MFGKALRIAGQVAIGVAEVIVFDERSRNTSADKKQLDGMSDGFGGVIADGEHYTREEAEDAQARGELYDTYL